MGILSKEEFETFIHEDIPCALFHVGVNDKDDETGAKLDEIILLDCLAKNPSALLYQNIGWFYERFIMESDSKSPYLFKIKVERERLYNPEYGDNRECECGHAYHRHFDSYEDMYNVGCKYCGCNDFKEKVTHSIPVAWDTSTNEPCSFETLTIGEKVMINENAKVLLGFEDGLEFNVVDVLELTHDKPIVLNCKEFGEDWVEFFSIDEIIKKDLVG